jgi:hypothetical protein
MPGQLLTASEAVLWAVQEFWWSLVFALASLLYRISRPSSLIGSGTNAHTAWSLRSTGATATATALPLLVWGIEANSFSRVVSSTHASTSNTLLLASMQVFAGGLICLCVVITLDGIGRFVEAKKSGQAKPLVLSVPVLLLLGSVVIDWLMSEIAWWFLLSKALEVGP